MRVYEPQYSHNVMNIDKKDLKPINCPMSLTYRENYIALWDVFGIYYHPYHPKVLQERMLTKAAHSVACGEGALQRGTMLRHIQQQKLVH